MRPCEFFRGITQNLRPPALSGRPKIIFIILVILIKKSIKVVRKWYNKRRVGRILLEEGVVENDDTNLSGIVGGTIVLVCVVLAIGAFVLYKNTKNG